MCPPSAAGSPGAPSAGQAWAAVVAQWIAGAIGGAALWVGFRFLWRDLPVVALAAALLVTVGLVLVVALSGGAVGPGRMAHVGAPLGEVLLLGLAAFTAGGAVGGPLATWWSRRHDVAEAEALATRLAP